MRVVIGIHQRLKGILPYTSGYRLPTPESKQFSVRWRNRPELPGLSMEQARTESRGAHRPADQLQVKQRIGEKDKYSIKIMLNVEAKRRQFPVVLLSQNVYFYIIFHIILHKSRGSNLWFSLVTFNARNRTSITLKHLIKVTGCDALLASRLEIGVRHSTVI